MTRNLNFKEFGSGKQIIILHGLLGSLDNWVSIALKLSKNYKVTILDLPNHGDLITVTPFLITIWQHHLMNL